MITLTPDQKTAQEAVYKFFADPVETVFVLSGYSGTGKSTLVKEIIQGWPAYQKTLKLIDPSTALMDLALTATTNKAAENFSQITGEECATIHSFLGLRVVKNYETGKTYLRAKSNEYVQPSLLFIDEASYIDRELLELIFSKTRGSKIVFIGDPAQLTAVRSNTAPVFAAGFVGAALTQVVRQAEGNPIIELATKFRNTVNTGEFFSFTPDGVSIQYKEREAFDQAVLDEFNRPDWAQEDSKFLAWTNKTVIAYNNAIHDKVSGSAEFKPGDYAVCNHFCTMNKVSLKTDELVYITAINSPTTLYGVSGRYFHLNGSNRWFVPDSTAEKKAAMKVEHANGDMTAVMAMDNWPDLRAAYAQTVNKSQGSTYGKVFIDLDDVARCSDKNQLARMLYVGVSRARSCVVLTGDLVY